VVDWYLMRAPEAFDFFAVDLLRSSPSFWAAQDDQRPRWWRGCRVSRRWARSRPVLDRANCIERLIERCRHLAVHVGGVRAGDDDRCIAETPELFEEFVIVHAPENRRVGDFIAVEVQEGQDGSITRGIEKLVAVPGGRERPRLGFPVADHAGDNEAGIVERSATSVRERVAKLAAFVNRTGRFRCRMARNAAGERELFEQPAQTVRILRYRRINFRISAFEISISHNARPAMTRPADVDHIEAARLDDPVEMDIDEIEAGRGAPVPQESRFNMLQGERFAQQRIVE